MTIDDTTLMALADGELDPVEAKRILALIADDTDAQTRLRHFTETRERLQQLAGQSEDAPGDAALIAMIRAASVQATSSGAAPLRGLAPAQAANRNRAPLAALAAAAAALAIGLGWWQMTGGPTGAISGGMPTDLVAALDSLPSGEATRLADGRELTMIASYMNQFSELCREYETHRDTVMHLSVACRDGDGGSAIWVARFDAGIEAPDGYVPASGDIDALDRYLADTGAGAPLTPDEEAAALAQ